MAHFITHVHELENRTSHLQDSCSAAPEVVRSASAATVRNFAPILPVATRRVDAYFRACVRRGALRAGGDPASRLILQAVVRDLASSGRSASEIWDELARGWSGTFSPVILDECRKMLGVAA